MPSSPGVEVRSHPTKGRALYATRQYEPGALILSVTPPLILPNVDNIERVCSYCLMPGDVHGCSRCHRAFYCDAECQRAGWKAIHGKECKHLQKNVRRNAHVPTPVRAVMYALLVDKIGQSIKDLEGNLSQWRSRSDSFNIDILAAGALTFAGITASRDGETMRQASEIYCKILTNAFQIEDEQLGDIGFFLEPTLARINHSCIPNAFVTLSDRTADLRAETPIQAGDEIEISYIDNTQPLSVRKEKLKTYNFVCQCPRCSGDLNIYQVHAMSPNISLNSRGIVPDISKLRNHPAATNTHLRTVAMRYTEAGAEYSDNPDVPNEPEGCLKFLLKGFLTAKPLVEEELWAVSPLPQILNEAVIYYNKMHNYPFSLFVACFVATRCDPFRYPTPFHPTRAIHLMVIIRLLAVIIPEDELLTKPFKSMFRDTSDLPEAPGILAQIDVVTTAHVLLYTLLGPDGDGLGLQERHLESAMSLLHELNMAPGRDEDLTLVMAWQADPTSDRSRLFFDYAVVRPIEILAQLGRKAIRQDFKV